MYGWILCKVHNVNILYMTLIIVFMCFLFANILGMTTKVNNREENSVFEM